MLWLFVMAVSCFMLQSMLSDTVICSTPCIPVSLLCPALPCPALPCPAAAIQQACDVHCRSMCTILPSSHTHAVAFRDGCVMLHVAEHVE